jgi:hypothetical protein
VSRYSSRPAFVAKCSEMARVVCGGVAGCPCVAFSLECFCSKTVKMFSELVYVV